VSIALGGSPSKSVSSSRGYLDVTTGAAASRRVGVGFGVF